jgi:protein-tyrosine phosphatase
MPKKSSHKVIIGCFDDLCYDKTPPYSTSSAIINCLSGNGDEEVKDGKPYLGMQLYDNFHISDWAFNHSIEFIKRNIKNGDVLVCCESGSSRSVAIGMAYHMSLGKRYKEAIKLLGKTCGPGRIHKESLLIWAAEKGYISKEEHKRLLKP